LPDTIQWLAAAVFALALAHTFAASSLERLAHRLPRHAGLMHLLGEVEVVFGLWAFVLLGLMASVKGTDTAVAYAESREYTEPLFVFVVMVVAASRPILWAVSVALRQFSRWLPMPRALAETWLVLAGVPLLGSLITEPGAMTIAALTLASTVFRAEVPERLKYAALGVLFVNVSIGGTLTSYAAPPVLMVATTWGWDSSHMLHNFGWKAVIAVLVNASAVTVALSRVLVAHQPAEPEGTSEATTGQSTTPVPLTITAVHFLFLAGVVVMAHHPVVFMGLFMMFLGFTQAYSRHQSPLIIKEGLLVGFFLAGLVVLGGLQQWWLQPLVAGLSPTELFLGALGLTAITDNAALTYLGSLIEGISDASKYMLVAGAVCGGGLTVIANAPNPAGVSLLRGGFAGGTIGSVSLLLGALPPTGVAALAFFLL
jgi:hypothetical protein